MMSKYIAVFVITFLLMPRVDAQEVDSLDIMIGQMVMVGLNDFDQKENRESTLKLIESGKIGGIILFEKDLKQKNTKSELAKLILTLQKGAEIPLFMGIDEEGGRVNRLKPKYGFPRSVSAKYLGELDHPDSTLYYGESTAKNLFDFGFNVNYAPTVDVNINPENPVIAGVERSYSSSHERVTFHAQKFIEGHEKYNIATVLKHFPGHGSSASDTHLGVADVSDSWRIEELYPYQSLIDSGTVRAVMSAHVVNKVLDDQLLPGSLSNKMINGVLRNFLGFGGVVFSDDMHMAAISKYYGLEDAIALAINAGLDVLMFSNNIFEDEKTTGVEIHDLIKEKVVSGEIAKERIQESYVRIMELKQTMGLTDDNYFETLEKRLKKQL